MIIILAGKIGELKILEDAEDLLSRVSKFFEEPAERHVKKDLLGNRSVRMTLV